MADNEKIKAALEVLKLKVEPEADVPGQSFDGCMQASIAISMKRIADVLDGTATGMCVTETIFGRKQV